MTSLLLLALAATPQERVAVMDLRPRVGVSADLAQTISDALVEEVRRLRPKLSVLSSEDLRSLVSNLQLKQQLGCRSQEEIACLAELGGALGASNLVVGTLAKLSNTYLLSVRLIDVRHAKILGSASERIDGSDQAQLIDGAQHAARELFPATPDAQAATPPSLTPPSPIPALTETPPPAVGRAEQRRSHLWSFVLGGTAVAALAVGGVAVGQIVGYDSFAGSLTATHPTSLASANHRVDLANHWANIGLAMGGLFVAAGAGAVLTW